MCPQQVHQDKVSPKCLQASGHSSTWLFVESEFTSSEHRDSLRLSVVVYYSGGILPSVTRRKEPDSAQCLIEPGRTLTDLHQGSWSILLATLEDVMVHGAEEQRLRVSWSLSGHVLKNNFCLDIVQKVTSNANMRDNTDVKDHVEPGRPLLRTCL
ncbi:unnamed protein product [Pleuronectes platessa]|uniref:Uncharacterized protein n=1 Tax=Pleuronectes platessa TaxID=8262 RepID=A0A9N7Y532_PLEPL|nr:unnamed protein product [Pleuronectes platessa]